MNILKWTSLMDLSRGLYHITNWYWFVCAHSQSKRRLKYEFMCLFWIISHDPSLPSEPIRTSQLQKILNLDFMTHRQCDSYISARLYICLTFSGISSDIFFLIAHRNSLPARLLTNSIWNYPTSPLIGCSKSKHNRWSEPDQSVTLFFVCKSRIGKYLTLKYILSGLLRILFSR